MPPSEVGLRNVGNTCYVNAVLQALMHTPAVAAFINAHGGAAHRLVCQGTKSEECVVCALGACFREIKEGKAAFKPEMVLNKMKRINKAFVPGRQEDAHEFVVFLIAKVHRTLKGLTSSSKLADTAWKAKTFPNIFCSVLVSEVTCCECASKSQHPDRVLELNLEVRRSLGDSLARFFKAEPVTDHLCASCATKGLASRRYRLRRAPKVLMLRLRRDVVGVKAKEVRVPETLCVDKHFGKPRDVSYTYTLAAMINHHGESIDSGHYTATVRTPKGTYRRFDDSAVKTTTLGAEAKNVYLLFYQRDGKTAFDSVSSESQSACQEVDFGSELSQTIIQDESSFQAISMPQDDDNWQEIVPFVDRILDDESLPAIDRLQGLNQDVDYLKDIEKSVDANVAQSLDKSHAFNASEDVERRKVESMAEASLRSAGLTAFELTVMRNVTKRKKRLQPVPVDMSLHSDSAAEGAVRSISSIGDFVENMPLKASNPVLTGPPEGAPLAASTPVLAGPPEGAPLASALAATKSAWPTVSSHVSPTMTVASPTSNLVPPPRASVSPSRSKVLPPRSKVLPPRSKVLPSRDVVASPQRTKGKDTGRAKRRVAHRRSDATKPTPTPTPTPLTALQRSQRRREDRYRERLAAHAQQLYTRDEESTKYDLKRDYRACMHRLLEEYRQDDDLRANAEATRRLNDARFAKHHAARRRKQRV